MQNTGSTEKNASTLVKNHRNSVSIPSFSTESVANDISCKSVETNASENEMVIADTSENFADGAGQMNESLVQILSEDELAALGGGTSADDGNIVFLYQPEDLFSISVDENPPLVDVRAYNPMKPIKHVLLSHFMQVIIFLMQMRYH